jgi:hypothetical protein
VSHHVVAGSASPAVFLRASICSAVIGSPSSRSLSARVIHSRRQARKRCPEEKIRAISGEA